MAEINIERKPPSIWPWLLGLAAIVAVIFIWAATGDPEEERTVAQVSQDTTGTSGTAGGAIDEYAQFARGEAGAGEAPQMGREHEYTAEGIRRLGGALESLIDQRPTDDGRARLERFQEIANRIQEDPTSAQHANQVRTAFTRATEVLASIDEAAAHQLRTTAEAVDPSEPLLEQREDVREFFRQSAEAIERAARATR